MKSPKREYDSYVSAIYKMLITQKPRHEVFDYLWWLETEHMGLTGDRQATEKFADRLMKVPEEVDKETQSPGANPCEGSM